MVGVPRSSGCRICVQRRVRCDGAKPICNNCRKGNRPCPGYGPDVKFQDEGPKLREKYRKGQQPLQSRNGTKSDRSLALIPPSSESSSPESNDWSVLGLDLDRGAELSRMNVFGFVEGKMKDYLNIEVMDTFAEYKYVGGFERPSPMDSFAILTAPVASPEATQLQLLSNFTHAMIPPEARFIPKALRGQGAWLTQLPELSGASLLLDSAIRAVTLVHIGRLHNNRVFVTESRPYYGKALGLLNRAIADKETGMDNKTLCATILLSFYEMFASDNDASWVRHAGGAGALMRMRGAKRHRYGFDRDIFLAYRHTLVIEAMSSDMPSFLDEPEWRQLSEEIYTELVQTKQIPPARVGIYDSAEEFYGLMASISVSSSRACHLHLKVAELGLSEDDEIVGILQLLQSHHDALHALFGRWQGHMKSIGLLPGLRPVNDPVIPYQYQYTNLFIASFYVGFWTTLMLTNSHIWALSNILDIDATSLVTENEEYALEACRSVEYMLTSSFLGPFFTIYALRFAFRIFKQGDIRNDWALCKLVEIGDRHMNFAKGAIGDGVSPGERPETFWRAAKQRLDEYDLAHRLKRQAGE